MIQDVLDILVKIHWHWTLLILSIALASFFLLFAGLYWLISHAHGDFELTHKNQTNFIPCIRQIYDFKSCLLFSIETQHTLGYGLRAPTEECPEAIFVNSIQCIIGDCIQGFMTGIIFAKMTRPTKRMQTLLFSKNAVISLRDGFLCLMFRVGDIRKDRIIDAQIKVIFVETFRTREGELLRHQQKILQVKADDCGVDMNFMWPMTIVHVIDQKSPLYKHSPEFSGNFEIVCLLEGSIESTGQSTQARTSYVANEILWGRKFEEILSYNSAYKEYQVDFSKFHSTVNGYMPGNWSPDFNDNSFKNFKEFAHVNNCDTNINDENLNC